jgi:glycosyltransferase involved in cell wall biosynthesis
VSFALVVPVYNEEDTLPELYRRIKDVALQLDGPLHIILIDDGSRDRSLDLIRELHEQDSSVAYISLARNFGHQVAISAGLQVARADAIIVMDADLQDPPELIPTLVERWKAGAQVVYARRTARNTGSWIKTAGAYVFYRLLARMTTLDFPPDTGDFCLMDRRVVDVLRALPERSRYLRGLRAWTGFRSEAVTFDRDPRFAGRSKYTYRKLFELAMNGIVSFSSLPLRIALYFGAAAAAVAVVLLGMAAFGAATGAPRADSRDAAMLGSMLFLGGVQLVCLGFIGQYIGQIHEEVKGRPLFTVKEAAGIGVSSSRAHGSAQAAVVV